MVARCASRRLACSGERAGDHLGHGPDLRDGQLGIECTPKLYPSAKGEYVTDVVAEMERLNVTAVVFGDPASVKTWSDAAPGRVIPGTSFNEGLQPGVRVPLEGLRKAFAEKGFKVMGEIGLQYEGLSPSDPSVDQYFALAEEGLIWSYPLKEVNRYIERLVDAGFADRVMFGTDQMAWPGLMAYSISLIQDADYLTAKQKRDILYHNAARFLRLDASPSSATPTP